MIEFQQVSKTYAHGYQALRRVSFQVLPGEMVFLTGHSGAGKSTLLKLISLVERCDSGKVIVNGQDLSRLPKRQVPYLRRNIGMIFQNHRLLMDRTVFDNVALPLVLAGTPHVKVRRRVQAALDKVGLLDKAARLPLMLSGGEQQRVGIARAIVNRPPLVIADEPTGNLDPELSAEIMKLFQAFNQIGVSILIATHALSLVARMKNRMLELQQGRLVGDNAMLLS